MDNPEEAFILSLGQEIHARALVRNVPALRELRYELVPGSFNERVFWKAYFSLLVRGAHAAIAR
jgi:hypothetical protein